MTYAYTWGGRPKCVRSSLGDLDIWALSVRCRQGSLASCSISKGVRLLVGCAPAGLDAVGPDGPRVAQEPEYGR